MPNTEFPKNSVMVAIMHGAIVGVFLACLVGLALAIGRYVLE